MGADLLLEIGTEELPSALVEIGREQLLEGARSALRDARLHCESVEAYSTPRRLAIIARDVADRQSAQTLELKGPSVSVAFDAGGEATRAAQGFAKSQGVDVGELQVRDVNGGRYVYAVKEAVEAPATDVLPRLCAELIGEINFPRSMRWGHGKTRFARPIRWLCCLYGDRQITFELENIKSGRRSSGHRILSPDFFEVQSPTTYVEQLRERKVLCDQDERRDVVLAEIKRAGETAGGQPYVNADVLLEVVNLVEWPSGLAGTFAPEFLSIPQEVVKTAMQSHQRYFPVENDIQGLLPAFIVIHNGDPAFASQIMRGHERVLRARLADGAFFFAEDTKSSLESKSGRLAEVVFQAKLGTVLEKTGRLMRLSTWLGAKLGYSGAIITKLERAALLCKVDLVTAMVGEFPDLQGVVGMEYARVDKEDADVARAIYEHYLPRFALDTLPAGDIGRVLSVADKVDSLAGFFAAGLIPSGSEDPYSLRRQAQGLVQITLENLWDISIGAVVREALSIYGENGIDITDENRQALYDFLAVRLGKSFVALGYGADTVEAVQGAGYDTPAELRPRLDALKELDSAKELQDAKAAFTRCENLADATAGYDISLDLLQEESERVLYRQSENTYKEILDPVRDNDFIGAVKALATLRSAIDVFFEAVLVMADDTELRRNRLALLNRCVKLSRLVCDFSKMA